MNLQKTIELSRSQAMQDVFAAYCNNFKRDGYFCDLGANIPIDGNNTFVLEKHFGWKGILVDYVPSLVEQCNLIRSNPCFVADLGIKPVTELLDEHNAPNILDFVSLDLDGRDCRLFCLKNIDLNKYKIRCICFEHDQYDPAVGPDIQIEARKYMRENGFELVCGNVSYRGWKFEDWFVHPLLVDMEQINKIKCEDTEYVEIFRKLSA